MIFTDLLEQILIISLGLPRMLAIFVMIPIFGAGVLVGSAKMVVALSFTLILYPTLAATLEPLQYSAIELFAIIAKEAIIGALMGFGLSVVFWAVESFGFLIDNQRGSTMASSVDPLTGSQTSPIGIFMMQVITIFYMVGGAFLVTLLAIYESYLLFPVSDFVPNMRLEGAIYFLGILDRIVALALVLAAPAMIAMFLSEFALGLISRFAPQLNVFFLSMPVKSAVGILMLILYIQFLPAIWNSEFAISATHIEILSTLFR